MFLFCFLPENREKQENDWLHNKPRNCRGRKKGKSEIAPDQHQKLGGGYES